MTVKSLGVLTLTALLGLFGGGCAAPKVQQGLPLFHTLKDLIREKELSDMKESQRLVQLQDRRADLFETYKGMRHIQDLIGSKTTWPGMRRHMIDNAREFTPDEMAVLTSWGNDRETFDLVATMMMDVTQLSAGKVQADFSFTLSMIKKARDNAQGAATDQDHAAVTNGGIDFNDANLNMQIKRDGQGMVLPVDQQDLDNIKIDGLVPVILNIQPASTLPLFSQLQAQAAGVGGNA